MEKTREEHVGNLLFYGVLFLLIYLVFRVFEPFLVPLGWAGVLGVIFYSSNKELEQRFGRTVSASLTTIAVTTILIVPTLLLTMLFVREGTNAALNVQASITAGEFGAFNRTWGWAVAQVARYSSVNLSALAGQATSRFGEYLASELGTVVRNIALFLFELFVALFALFYCLRDGDAILNHIRRLLPFGEGMRERMLAEARDLIFASVTTGLVIAAVQGVICGGALAVVGIGSPVFWGVIMAFLSLLPVVGAWPIWIPAAIWLFSTGHSGRALILIAICGGVGSTIDNILRPVLLAGRASLNGLLVFIGVLGGIIVFGVLGIVLGPIVVATAVGVLDVYSKSGTNGEASSAVDERP